MKHTLEKDESIVKSVKGKQWVMKESSDDAVRSLMQKLDIPEQVARLLDARGVTLEDAQAFLNPKIKDFMPDPSTLKDMDKAVKRLAHAIMIKEPIAVFGDYDVDGATSSALMKRFFKAAGHDIEIYIPDRIEEGYGPNTKAFDALQDKGYDFIVTVDCGVTAHGPLEGARDNDQDIVVIDHHMVEDELPPAHAIINPNRKDEDGSLGHLCAAGVTFMTLVALNRELRNAGWYKDQNIPEPNMMAFLDIVALGTVADVVPLTGLNRAFVAQGLKVMEGRKNEGLKALIKVAGINNALESFHCGFMLGPRINAGGRVGQAYLGAHLLSTEDEETALKIAHTLNEYNEERRAIEKDVLAQAIDDIDQNQDPHSQNMIFVAGEGWHPGVIGIVASRLKEKYNRPVAVVAFDENGVGKASARSVDQIHYGEAVIKARAAGLLVNGGGHKMSP